MSSLLRKLFVACFLMLSTGAIVAQVHRTEQIEVELISETTNVVPGETTWLAIRLDPIEHWHTYWKFGGDSGEATEARDWQLPAGVEVGEIVWPMPEWTPFLGSELVTFTYEREVLLPIPLRVPADFTGDEIELTTTIAWQVCEQICIPGQADFALTLPLAESLETDPEWQALFAATRARTPTPIEAHDLVARFNDHDGKINVMVQGGAGQFAAVEEAWFFPTEPRLMRYAPYRNVMLDGDRLQISTEQHRRYAGAESIPGLLAFVDEEGNWQGWDVQASATDVAWDHSIEVELLAEDRVLAPGETTWLGVRLAPAEHWHTYWKMGGDSGEPTSLNDWQAPEGTRVGDIAWPTPEWLPFYDTGLVNFGYEQEVLLPVPVTLPGDYSEPEVTLSTLVYWNVCEQICIPGEQRLSLTLPVAQSSEVDPARVEVFAAARAELPIAEHDIQSFIVAAGDRVSLGFEAGGDLFAGYTDAFFFPELSRVIKPGPLRDVTLQPDFVQITHQQPRRMLEDLSEVYGVLLLESESGARIAYDFQDPAADASTTTIAPLAANAGAGDGSGPAGPGLLLAIAFALAGGLILNLMPCVFPVLSMKALSLAKSSGESRQQHRMHGLVYTGGIVLAFVVLASVLIALRAGGEAVGWAFQFQQPWFLAFIVYVFFLLGLSLSGVFEIGTSFMGVGGNLASQGGYRGSFFTGVLATVVATPCTAPFMGPAIGFALTQPWIVAMAVFIALGVGMALPILLLSFSPALGRYLPKPGAWMETFKQVMAFPMYVSALFFLWVLGTQVGVMGMSLVLGVCILMAFAAWFYQRRFQIGPVLRGFSYATAVLTLGVAVYLLQTPFLQTAPGPVSAAAGSGEMAQSFEPFSRQRLDELQAQGRPVFVNMTAAWCITCLANEQTTLSTDRVKRVMAEQGITYLKGDWTNEDPEITAVLNQFNRPSVPLYILYSGDSSQEPVILPQILTPNLVAEAFQNL